MAESCICPTGRCGCRPHKKLRMNPQTNMSMRHEIKEFLHDDQHSVAAGSIGYQPWILTPQNNEYLEAIMANLIKGNAHYLATHKQVTGIMSMILYKVLEKKPIDAVTFMRHMLMTKDLKYTANKYLLKNGYKRTPGQVEHELQFLEASARAHIRSSYEDKVPCKPMYEGGKFSLTPYGPPLSPIRVPFKKTHSACVAHGLIPFYMRTKEDEKIFVARDQSAWPSLFY